MLFSLLLACLPAAAAPEPLSLKEALERAMVRNGELHAQQLQVRQAEQDVRRVAGEFGPKVEALAGIGPITRATGNATSSSEEKGSFGRIIIGKFTLTQPLFTWGRKGNYENAALAGVQVERAEVASKADEVRHKVKEAYHGYQLANSLRDFIEGGKAELKKALEKRKKSRKETPDDYRLEIFLAEVESREAEINKYYQLAREGLALMVGEPRGAVEVKDPWLIPESREKRPVEHYVELARASRPEFKQLAEGIFAKRSLARAERKALLPALVFLASYELADTNVRPPQPGVFAYDPYNRESWAIGLGFKLDFQWTAQDAKAGKLQAEALELEAKEAYALRGIETEVRKAYLELQEAEDRLAAAKIAYGTGKRWLTRQVMGLASGLGDSRGLTEAFAARAETTKNYFEAVFRHHMAWAQLSKVVGQEVDPVLQAVRR